jgi:hypothetical protein
MEVHGENTRDIEDDRVVLVFRNSKQDSPTRLTLENLQMQSRRHFLEILFIVLLAFLKSQRNEDELSISNS